MTRLRVSAYSISSTFRIAQCFILVSVISLVWWKAKETNRVLRGNTAAHHQPNTEKVQRLCPQFEQSYSSQSRLYHYTLRNTSLPINHSESSTNLSYPIVRTRYYGAVDRPHIGYGGPTGKALFERYGWTVTTGDDWDLLWTFMPQYSNVRNTYSANNTKKSRDNHLIFPWQRHNHCFKLDKAFGIQGTKQSQWECYARMRERFGKSLFDYMPESYDLPRDFAQLRDSISSNIDAKAEDRYWVLKPAFGAHGRGIHIVKGIDGLRRQLRGSDMLAQEYVTHPMLTRDGRKFHLRIYTLVTSAQPPRVLVFRDGMMMVASKPFTLSPESLSDKHVHLTNSAAGAEIFAVNGCFGCYGWLSLGLVSLEQRDVQPCVPACSRGRGGSSAFPLTLSARPWIGGMRTRGASALSCLGWT
eukprot:m.365735 g.365735  ORF g.365735 m.365735 type:complete len:414 (-) comp20819_c0_seq14:940-2181(-)